MSTAVFRIETPGLNKAREHLTRFEKSLTKIEKRLQGLKQLGGKAKLTMDDQAGGVVGELLNKLQAVQTYTSRIKAPLSQMTSGLGSGMPAAGSAGSSGAQGGGTAARPEAATGKSSGGSFLDRVENSLSRAGETLTTIRDFIGKVKGTVKEINSLINTFKTTLKSVGDMIALFKGAKKGASSGPALPGKKKAPPITKEKEIEKAKATRKKAAAVGSAEKTQEQVKNNEKRQRTGREKSKNIIDGKRLAEKADNVVKPTAVKAAKGGFFGKLLKTGRGAVGKVKGLKIPYVDLAMGAAEIITAEKGNRWAKAKELVVEKGGSAVGTAIGTLFGGPVGGMVGAQLGSLAGEKLFAFLESKFGPAQEAHGAQKVSAGNELGIGINSLGGSQPVSYMLPAEKARQELQVTVNVSPDFKISTYVTAEEVLNTIKDNLNALTEEIGERLAESLQGRWSNTVLDGGD